MLKIGDKVRSKKGLFEVGEVVGVWEANTNLYATVEYDDPQIPFEIDKWADICGIQEREFELLESSK